MSTKFPFALVPLFLAGSYAASIHAQCEVDRLSPPRGSNGFGSEIVIEGNVAVIAAPGDFGNGKAVVFRHDGVRWRQEQELVAGRGFLGLSVALSGNTILVGSLFNDPTFVFVHDGSRWVLQQGLTSPGRVAGDLFGAQVSLDGDTAVVSAQTEDTATARDSGAAYVFVRSGSVWTLQQRLAPNDAAEGDVTGPSAISGDEILLGSPGKKAVYVFRRTGSTWNQVQKLTAAGAGLAFGRSITREGDRAVIASFEDDHSGAAYVFERQGGAWIERQKLVASDSARLGIFGFSLDLSGDALVIGRDREGSGPAAGYLFRRLASGWTESGRLVPSDPPELGPSGAVAIEGSEMLLGASFHSAAGPGAGLVFVFRMLDASLHSFNGRGINADTLVASTATPGRTWSATVAVNAPRNPGVAYVLVTERCQGGTLVTRKAEYLLAGRPLLLLGPLPHAGQGSLVPFTASAPVDPSFLGQQWAAQGIVWDGSLGLTNAIASTVR
jgi:hypothetical protein